MRQKGRWQKPSGKTETRARVNPYAKAAQGPPACPPSAFATRPTSSAADTGTFTPGHAVTPTSASPIFTSLNTAPSLDFPTQKASATPTQSPPAGNGSSGPLAVGSVGFNALIGVVVVVVVLLFVVMLARYGVYVLDPAGVGILSGNIVGSRYTFLKRAGDKTGQQPAFREIRACRDDRVEAARLLWQALSSWLIATVNVAGARHQLSNRAETRWRTSDVLS
ncbi:hypothetical protein B0H14DRAFT_2606532 [Mycena olivaceomarginata]|nr:hypothetical protein B0H14DRAFT_2606532 [Mycena olivaceomarginata]